MLNNKLKIVLLIIIVAIIGVMSFLFFQQKNKIILTQNKNDSTLIIEKLKNLYPDITDNQLQSYIEISKNPSILPCLDKDDKKLCISSIAFISKQTNFCAGLVDNDSQFICSNIILSNFFEEQQSNCESLTPYETKVKCISTIFSFYRNMDDCSTIVEENIKKTCEDIINYKRTFNTSDGNLCNDIIDADLKSYCIDEIGKYEDTDKDGVSNIREQELGINPYIADTDNDGLMDGEERYKYFSEPLNNDSDNDGFGDGEEVKNGYNPNGQGLLIK